MKQIADITGTPITGMYRGENGAIIINDARKKAKYDSDRLLTERVSKLETSMSNIERMLEQLLRTTNQH